MGDEIQPPHDSARRFCAAVLVDHDHPDPLRHLCGGRPGHTGPHLCAWCPHRWGP